MAEKTTLGTASEFILDKIGGAENVASMTHCATRLRFQLNDQSKADQKALDSHPKVLGVVPQGSNGLQVVKGGDVANYYQELTKLPGMGAKDSAAESSKKQYDGVRGKYSWVDYCFEFLSDTFRPILWALLGASLIITMLVLADTFGWQDFRQDVAEQPPVYQLLHAMWTSVFYFLPVMIGATAARKLGANEWVGAAIPAALLTPAFMAMGSKGDVVDLAGLPLVINEYSGQVFPPIMAAIGLFWVEKGLKKIIPSAVQMVFVPFISLLIMIPATAFLLGPFGIFIGNGITSVLTAVNGFSPFILAILVPCLYPFLVPLGLHWPLNAIMIQNIATLGYDFIQGPMGAWNFACFGVVTGVMVISIREKNNGMRQVSLGAMMAGLLGGISEPSLYGVLLRFRKTYFRLIPGCIAGGVVMGIFNVKAQAFVFTSLLTIGAMDPAGGYAIGIAVAFFTSMFLVIFLDYRTKEERDEVLASLASQRETEIEAAPTVATPAPAATPAAAPAAAATSGGAVAVATPVKTALEEGALTELVSPLAGAAITLSEVPDPIFAAEKLGKGVAIVPTGTTVYAPADATVISVPKSGHAVGLRLDNGIELLVHVGIDTVQLGGEGFEIHVERKQHVTAGTPLISFDPEFISSKGYNLVTPVLVTNHAKFSDVSGLAPQNVDTNTVVIRTQK
ncbi:glucose PTS transporter subunit IIA [Corynebacterium sp. ES2775-CONJ]|uniref:glucose PTS transporter subunit IIA n=1 Tax=Corynebacterium sp. ES2775-CONJ TaxID=2974029 RepID=UPI002167D1AA|nr:glucose PTS transporter subunit IIA [Corynebacterium sp. ES2775-CONJ]MCS4490741.1 glucose PTS transporter subunit IIA [Corynebacterium sp. ES2775-CONJ]